MIVPDGQYSGINYVRGALVEYGNTTLPSILVFDFNPTTISRSRSATLESGNSKGGDFQLITETQRAAQSVTVNPEVITVKILLDATGRMNQGDPAASSVGIQPELDTLRSMGDPKYTGKEGSRVLNNIGQGGENALSHTQSASVLLFMWGVHILPVFLKDLQIDLKEFLPSLLPYRAEVSLTLQLIESDNPFYAYEIKRQDISKKIAQVNTLLSLEGII